MFHSSESKTSLGIVTSQNSPFIIFSSPGISIFRIQCHTSAKKHRCCLPLLLPPAPSHSPCHTSSSVIFGSLFKTLNWLKTNALKAHSGRPRWFAASVAWGAAASALNLHLSCCSQSSSTDQCSQDEDVLVHMCASC